MKGEEWETEERHTATPPAYLYTQQFRRITLEVDNTALAEYFIHADLEPRATRRDSTTIAERSTQKILYLVVKKETWACNITPGLIANQWSWWDECGGDNNRPGLPYISYSCTVPNTNHSRRTNKSSVDVIIPQQKKSIICHQGLSTSEQGNVNDRNIIPTDCSEGFGMSIDWWLNLNAITYLAAPSRIRDYLILLGCAYVRKYALSLGHERKMPIILRKTHRRSRWYWM